MQPVSSPGLSSKRRRPIEMKGSRRFSTKDSRKKEIIPLSTSAPVSKKTKHVRKGVRLLTFIALFFIILSTVSVWHRRANLRRETQTFEASPQQADGEVKLENPISASENQPDREDTNEVVRQRDPEGQSEGVNSGTGSEEENQKVLSQPDVETHDSEQKPPEHNDSNTESNHDENSENSQSDTSKASEANKVTPEDHPHKNQEEEPKVDIKPVQHEKPVPFEDVPERIEWYTRLDFKGGSRPICRITHPFILSNGTILLPDWMERHERILHRCALGSHGYYSPEVPPTAILKESHNIDVDFALTIHLERFQEPTHDPSVFLTEHLLKSSYLFDIFTGNAKGSDAFKEKHCITALNGSECELPRPPPTGLKPGLFVPHRIETGQKGAWIYQMIDLFGTAYGSGEGVVHLNTSSVIMAPHQGKSDELVGTRFRSIMTMDGMFRHLPAEGLKHSLLYSKASGIDKQEKQFFKDGKCSLTIGIASSEQADGFKGAAELQDKLNVMIKFAMPSAAIDVNLIEPTQSLPEAIKQMQKIDIFLGGSGPELSNIGFMQPSSTVYELMPFAITPLAYQSLAKALGLNYESIRAKPRDDLFKKCIDGEIFQLRKQGKVSFSDSPDWLEPLMKAWDAAVAEFVLSGKSDFDVLTADPTIKNYQSRVCALRQEIEIGLDETARTVILTVKSKCGSR